MCDSKEAKYGVRIVRDDDWTPDGKEAEDREEARKIESGEYSVYGVIAIKECADCGSNVDSHAMGSDLWNIVVETYGAEGTYFDLATIPDEYLREVAKENIAEAKAYDQEHQNPQGDDGLVTVTFRWDPKNGPCYDCGKPAAFKVSNPNDTYGGPQPIKVCAVCGCNRAVDGDTITRIDSE